MEEFRSKSYNDGRMQQIEAYNYGGGDKQITQKNRPSNLQDLRCYSASYASSSLTHMETSAAAAAREREVKFKKVSKSTNGSMSKNWSFTTDPELQRKKRVASYKVYTVEGKVKGTIRKSFRWLKDRYSQMVYGVR